MDIVQMLSSHIFNCSNYEQPCLKSHSLNYINYTEQKKKGILNLVLHYELFIYI